MYIDNGNNFDWIYGLQNVIKDSSKHAEELLKLFSIGQGLAQKISDLKNVKLEVNEKTLQNDQKTFTLKIKGSLNLTNKDFVSEIAEKFGDILESYKKQKMEELSKEMDDVLNKMKNMFNTYNLNVPCGTGNGSEYKTWASASGNLLYDKSITGMLNENYSGFTYTNNVEWKKDDENVN